MAAHIAFNFNEQFGLKIGYQKVDFEYDNNVDFGTWYVEPKVVFNENFILKGAYYSQDTVNDPTAWRAIFEVKQEALNFTSLWLEYNKIDAGFVTPNSAAFGFIDMSKYEYLYGNYGVGGFKQIQNDATIWRIGAHQKWNDKWDTFLHYAKFDIDGLNAFGNSDATNYSIGFNYHYTLRSPSRLPTTSLTLLDPDYDDHMIHFRTSGVLGITGSHAQQDERSALFYLFENMPVSPIGKASFSGILPSVSGNTQCDFAGVLML